jgi:hypothetical protein
MDFISANGDLLGDPACGVSEDVLCFPLRFGGVGRAQAPSGKICFGMPRPGR